MEPLVALGALKSDQLTFGTNITMRIGNLDKLNLNDTLILGSSHFSITVPIASKNTTHFKSGLKWLENSHLATFTKLQSKSLLNPIKLRNLN